MQSFSSRSLIALLLVVTVTAVLALLWWSQGGGDALARFGNVPEFTLTDQEGRPLSNHDLAGQIWVANFVFTRCQGTCPMLTRRMQDVERWMKDHGHEQMKIVSFSVDPKRDTPEDLKSYAAQFGIDTTRWKFITGPEPELRRVVIGGFKTGMQEVGEDATLFDILHGERFVLIDRQGEIRGFFASDREGLNDLKAGILRLDKERVASR